MSSLAVRELYRTISKTKGHLVQSREIATTCVCPYLFKMCYPFGVPPGEQDFLIANTVHDIMSLAMPTTILHNWQQDPTNFESLARSIDRDSSAIVEKVIQDAKDVANREGKTIPTYFEYDVQDRFHGLLIGISKKLMKKYSRPKRAITEITITNVKKFQEGRIDALLEFDDDCYGLIDWKTNDIDKFKGSGIDKWQLIANFLLANYRYTGNEDNWSKCLFGSVVFYENAYFPRLPLKQEKIDKVKYDRKFAHDVLCGGSPYTQKPAFCPVCDREGESSSDCHFYREDSRMAGHGTLPPNYASIRRHLIKRRYLVLDERSETHKHKFVISNMIERLGESIALQELEKSDVVYSGFRLGSTHENLITLVREVSDNPITFLEPSKVVRIIGKEDSRPLLGCINEKGFVKDATESKLVVSLDKKIYADRAKEQLLNFPIVIIRDENNLTRRTLEPMHRFHRLAADLMLPRRFFDNN